ncbi:hypothetical protein TVAG_045330 [Trichomonas vaginalis G3]|uniref:Uncharacterized protein n=1 Tax=Trichomonas vaginalis (strain ATCC PRA-98 / G3) TaxID=412133 RepID=A2FHG9_TRIV3|nr:VPS8 subunit of corvet complex family [Trichomonas vaginalis G3]EAX95645.1 hypothetical protein TVAG_045330 [Trichomonas vaginalis G3]KAI5503036.1 VPS8 subunit of corvet complex family [Trichomonas vaginalis G3]|eukprot:XP_001308575.1 hypothetical protein [Trichomonas vaginalis G3]
MESILKKKNIGGVHVDSDTISCIHYDTLYIFLTASGNINAFDASSAFSWKFPKHDSSIQADIISLAASPTHSYVAAGFSNGSLQLYEMKSKKWLKPYPGLVQGPITGLAFINDQTMLASDGSENLYKFTISAQLWGTSVNKSLYYTSDFPILNINLPSIFVQGKLIAPAFQNISILSCSGTLKLMSCGHEIVVLKSYDVSAHISAIYVVSPSLLYFCICERRMIRIFSLDDKLSTEEIYKHEIDVDPQYVGFLSQQIVVIISKNLTVTVVYFTENTFINEKLPSNSLIISGLSEFYIVNEGDVNSISLCTYQDHFENIVQTGDFSKIIDLCKRAYNGEPSVSIGLPPNQKQRAVMIERNLSGQFNYFAEEKLKAKEDPSAVAKEVIKLSVDLGMRRWAIEHAISLFDSYESAEPLFKQIIEIDTDATRFEYSSQFVERLLSEDIKIPEKENIVFKLPNKVAKTETLLKYAQSKKDYVLLGNLLKNRVKDNTAALSSYMFSGNHKKTSEFLRELIQNGGHFTILVIRWLSEISSQKTFDHLAFLLEEDNDQTSFIVSNVLLYLERYAAPFPMDYFFSILLQTLSNMGDKINQTVISTCLDFIIDKRVTVAPENLHFILKVIFDTKSTNNKREKALLQLLNTQIDSKLFDTMITLCDALHFHDAKIEIFIKMKRFDKIINEFITENKTGVFDYLKKYINDETSNFVLDALKKNSTALVLLDVSKFKDLLFEKYNSQIFDVVTSIEDQLISMYFVREILNDSRSEGFKLPEKIFTKFINFLCIYYPREVIKELKSIDLNQEILEICYKNTVYDAVAYIERQFHQLTDAYEALQKYIVQTIIEFKNNAPIADTEQSLNFIVNFIADECKSKTQEFVAVVGDIIRSFAVVFTFGKDDKLFLDSLKKICLYLCNVVSHGVVMAHVENGYKDVDLGKVRDLLGALIYDFDFVVDSSANILTIYKNDEEKSFNDVRQTMSKPIEVGTFCSFCQKPIVNSDVRVFGCGHYFHSYCCARECRVCNPTAVPVSSHAPFSMDVKVRLFERHLRETNMFYDEEEPEHMADIKLMNCDADLLMKGPRDDAVPLK